jgi:hypothetical protein
MPKLPDREPDHVVPVALDRLDEEATGALGRGDRVCNRSAIEVHKFSQIFVPTGTYLDGKPARSIDPLPMLDVRLQLGVLQPMRRVSLYYPLAPPLISIEFVRRLTVFCRKCAIVETEMDLFDMGSIPSALPHPRSNKGKGEVGRTVACNPAHRA